MDSRLANREARRLNKLQARDPGHFEMRPRDPREILAKVTQHPEPPKHWSDSFPWKCYDSGDCTAPNDCLYHGCQKKRKQSEPASHERA